MAHNLNFNEQTGKHSFMSVKEKAWHGLGQIIDQYPTSSEAIQHSGLDYIVEKRPLFTFDTQNFVADAETDIVIPELEVPNFFATVRADNDKVLGVVGKDYEVVQNRDAFAAFDAIVGGDGILYETAGALGDGEKIFITAKMPDYIKIGKDDIIEKYLFLTTSHDGSESITAAFTPVRIVCQNTLNAALRNMTNVYKIRHTQSANERLKQVHTLMGLTNELSVQMEGIFNRWSRIKISDVEVMQLIQLAMAPSNEVYNNIKDGNFETLSKHFVKTVDKVCEYAFSDDTQQMATTKGTLFGAYNAISGYYQNVKDFNNGEAKLKNIMFGSGQKRTQKAFDLCTDFVKHGVLNMN